MRTTIDIPDQLFREAKAQAALRGIRLRDIMEEGLRHVLEAPVDNTPKPQRVSFPILESKRRGHISAEAVYAAEQQVMMEEDIARSSLV
jgi:hypothetical protein